MERDDEPAQLAYAQALADWADAGGYDIEVLWDACCTTRRSACRTTRSGSARCAPCRAASRSGSCWRRCCAGRTRCCCSTSRTTTSTCPASEWLEQRLRRDARRRCCTSATTASCWPAPPPRIVTLELGAAGNTAWMHGGGFADYHEARADAERPARGAAPALGRGARQAQGAGADATRTRPTYNDGMATPLPGGADPAAQVRGGRPAAGDRRASSSVSMRLHGGRTGKRAVVCEQLELTGLMAPFDLEVWFGERVAVLGSNGSGKSHFLRLLALGGSDPEVEHRPVGDVPPPAVAHTGVARLGARVRPGWFAQTHEHPELVGRTLLEILHRGDEHRDGHGPRAGEPRARPVRARARRRAAVRDAVRRAAGPVPDPAAGAVRRDAAAARRADGQPRPRQSPRRWRRGSTRSRARSSRSPTTGGSPAASTASWCSAPTARSARPPSRCGTRPARSARSRRTAADAGTRDFSHLLSG